ncbi:MAG: hypothetical protein LBM98_02395 [Oscillospiraceae bacterium]|jgi:hypothetical protein|nr:hypothetical protein [Oscillospiraceae bacterium]
MIVIGIVILAVLFVAVVVLIVLLRAELKKTEKNDEYRKYVSNGVMTPLIQDEDIGMRIYEMGNALAEARRQKAEDYCENACPYRETVAVAASDGSVKGEVGVCEKGWNRVHANGTMAGVNPNGVAPNYDVCPDYQSVLDGK